MNRRLALVAGLAGSAAIGLAAESAHATFFSFASDVNSNSFTFAGTAGSGGSFNITDFSRPNTFTLLIDDNNGPNPTVSIPVEFHANLTLSGGTSTQVAGNLYQHAYRVLGTFGFYDTMGNALLTVNVGPNAGVLSVPGTATSWSTSGAVLGADSFADVTYTASTAFINALGGTSAAALYGISVGAGGTGTSIGPDDFSFSLSSINAGSIGAAVGIDATTKAPTSAWRSESSYSGTAVIGVPSPAVCSLMGMGALLLGARRTRR